MADSSRPEEIRGTSFGQVRRGYDRAEVDRFRDQVAGEIESLLERVAALEQGGAALGIDDAESLRAELATVSEDVAEVLAAAQQAAEGIRSRAAADAGTWRAEADAEARRLRATAQRDAEQARGDAWETATELLDQAETTAREILDAASEDALFIRAEAEREALRLTGDARRDQDDIVRTARTEADRMVDAARVEAEHILDDARTSAAAAQERAAALERRRGELMEELEAARLSIGDLDTRRESAIAPPAPPAESAPASPPDYDWQEEDTSVRVVPGHVVPVDHPVDADSLVAEVEALQRAIDAVNTPSSEPDRAALEAAAEGVVPAAFDDEPDVVVTPTASAPTEADGESPMADTDIREAEAPVTAEVAEMPVDTPAPPPPAEVAQAPEEGAVTPMPLAPEELEAMANGGEEDTSTADVETVVVEATDTGTVDTEAEPSATAAAEEAAPAATALDSLFARLREPAAEETDQRDLAATEEAPSEEIDIEDTAEPEAPAAGLATVSPIEAPAAAAETDPFELRDRLLLPIENRALRSVKRRIVDLQNRVLEELRVGPDDWVPDRAMLGAAVGDEMVTLAAESHVAGHTAAADLSGSGATPQPVRGPAIGESSAFVASLGEAVGEALSRARASGGGTRQVAAAASRVFRAWRTDEAERRLRRAARRAYHEGVVAGMEQLGVERVMAISDGQPCGRCPAHTGVAWRPGSPLPAGTAMPPADIGCSGTIVPAG